MDWEALFQQWVASLVRTNAYYVPKGATKKQWDESALNKAHNLREKLEAQARTILSNRTLTDVGWLIKSLKGILPEQKQKQGFIISSLRQATQIPDALLEPLLKASLFTDPSSNSAYIGPCLRCFGPRKVNEILFRHFEKGTNEEKTGAANGFYWALRNFHTRSLRLGLVPHENINDLHVKVRYAFLTTFLRNEDVPLRRSLIARITQADFTRSEYPKDTQTLLRQVLRIARSHSDEYIRYRVSITPPGEVTTYKPLPKQNRNKC